MASIVEVKLELGHRARVRDVPSAELHTHDWVIFVKGSDGVQLEHFVEKVVFWLHESYELPKRVIKRPPYKVEQSGFAGFNMLIDVHFRNKEDPKMVRFQYDLFLHTKAMPPVNHTRLEKLTFTNPTEDFRKKLLAAGAVECNTGQRPSSSSRVKEKPEKTSPVGAKKDKEKTKVSKEGKHKDRSLSASGREPEEKRRSSSHSGRKDGRIATKDMFKQPKTMLNTSRIRKDSEGSEKMEPQHERGRPEKRRSVATEEENSKKKKKRQSEDIPVVNEKLKKPLVAGTSTVIPPKKENKKVKKIKENTSVVAGLFAPETSINLNQIKPQKEKSKQENGEVKVKKDKTGTTPSRDSPYPGQETPDAQHGKSGTSLTLKIKKEKKSSVAKVKKEREPKREHSKEKKKASREEEKRHSKESVSSHSSDSKGKLTMSQFALGSDSSSSDSDMNNRDSEMVKKTVKPLNTSPKPPRPEGSSKRSRERTPKGAKIPEKKSGHPEMAKEPKKSKMEKSHSFSKESPIPKPDLVQPKPEIPYGGIPEKKSGEFSKHKKSSKGEQKSSSKGKRDSSQGPKKSKKHSSKEGMSDKSSKRKSSGLEKTKRDKMGANPIVDMALSPLSVPSPQLDPSQEVKKSPMGLPEPGASFMSEPSPRTSSGSRKSSKSRTPGSEKPPNPKPPKQSQKNKLKTSVPKKSTPGRDSNGGEPKKVYKSRSFIEMSSSDDSDEDSALPPPPPEPRRRSVSVPSSPSEENDSASSVDDQKSPPDPMVQDAPSPSSESEKETDLGGFSPVNTSSLAVISPIADRPQHETTQCTVDQISAYQDMEMSDSSAESPFHEPENPEATENLLKDPGEVRLPNFALEDDLKASSSDEENSLPPEKPFQYQEEEANPEMSSSQSEQEDTLVKVRVDPDRREYPNMNSALYEELQELQRKISIVTDAERLRKIASIVARSQKLQLNSGYCDFDLCSLDHKTIHKIQKQLKAL